MKKCILVVDDDPGSRRLLQFVLAKTGYNIVTAANGVEALVQASEHTVHLLITDLMMKGLSGFDIISKLHSFPQYANLPVIMLTARGHVESMEEAQAHKIAVFLTKPFSPIELIAQAKQLIGT